VVQDALRGRKCPHVHHLLDVPADALLVQFREIPKSELPEGIDNATSFTSVCINTAIYLPWLVSQCLKNGVIVKRAVFKHIADAAAAGVHHSGSAADLVVNCTGLSSYKLGGVEDKTMVPIRGQIVVVRNSASAMYATSGTDEGPDELCYIMTRAAGGGTVLGGCYQKGNWESQPDPSLAVRIMKRCVAVCPELTGGKGIEHLDIIRHGVGLRPGREAGTRIEKEKINGVWVVHNYGAGGKFALCRWLSQLHFDPFSSQKLTFKKGLDTNLRTVAPKPP
jgi:D-amino-acid oxidase